MPKVERRDGLKEGDVAYDEDGQRLVIIRDTDGYLKKIPRMNPTGLGRPRGSGERTRTDRIAINSYAVHRFYAAPRPGCQTGVPPAPGGGLPVEYQDAWDKAAAAGFEQVLWVLPAPDGSSPVGGICAEELAPGLRQRAEAGVAPQRLKDYTLLLAGHKFGGGLIDFDALLTCTPPQLRARAEESEVGILGTHYLRAAWLPRSPQSADLHLSSGRCRASLAVQYVPQAAEWASTAADAIKKTVFGTAGTKARGGVGGDFKNWMSNTAQILAAFRKAGGSLSPPVAFCPFPNWASPSSLADYYDPQPNQPRGAKNRTGRGTKAGGTQVGKTKKPEKRTKRKREAKEPKNSMKTTGRGREGGGAPGRKKEIQQRKQREENGAAPGARGRGGR